MHPSFAKWVMETISLNMTQLIKLNLMSGRNVSTSTLQKLAFCACCRAQCELVSGAIFSLDSVAPAGLSGISGSASASASASASEPVSAAMSGPQDYDRKYLRSMPGLCKMACLLCSFIGFLCIVCGPVRVSNFRGSFYLAVASIGFVTTAALLLARYLRMWQRQFSRCDPTLWSLAVHSSLALAYFAASGLVLSLDIGAYTAAAFFGLTAFSINGLEAYGNYRRSRQREVATQTI